MKTVRVGRESGRSALCALAVCLASVLVIASAPRAQCPGDLTGSGQVNVFDLLELLSCWGPVQQGCEAADLDDDGSINVFDLLSLLGSWGECPCQPNCDGAACGGDGCGGSCGSCGGANMCQNGQCVPATGACCWPGFGNVCTMSDPWTCGVSNSGAYAGNGTTCDTPCPTVQSGSCYGRCGQYATGCWCDIHCISNNDCCADVCNWCGNLSGYWWCN